MSSVQFWKTTKLKDMSQEQWESLCDGCARCCLQKLQDDETDKIYYTNVVCQYMKQDGQCSHYQDRQTYVPDCVWLTPADAAQFHWLPDSCSYRLVSEGKDIPTWHPLKTGTQQSVVDAGFSVLCQELVPDNTIEEEKWQEQLIEWVQYEK